MFKENVVEVSGRHVAFIIKLLQIRIIWIVSSSLYPFVCNV